MSQKPEPVVGQIKTVPIHDGYGRKTESYRVDVLDEFGNRRRLLLSPAAFFQATRLFSRELLLNQDAA